VGYISSTVDALVLIEGCLSGHLNHVPRRPQDRERPDLIQSGNIFIYEEHASGIKRWTDGVNWSPSRILGNFLIYRELEKPFPPGEKKRALKKQRKAPANGIVKRSSQSPPPRVGAALAMASSASTESGMDKDVERALVGSLVDSYAFKEKGLVKKTISVNYRGVLHHVVSYYNCDDVLKGKLRCPSETPELIRNCIPRTDLISRQNFRAPLEHTALYTLNLAAPLPGVYQPESQMPSQNNMPGNVQQHYRPLPMSSLPPPMPFPDQSEFSWHQMPSFMDDGFQQSPQQHMGNVQFGHSTPQSALLPFDPSMSQNVTPHPMYHIGGSV